MPSVESASRNQSAVLWAKSSLDNFGKPTVDSPLEIYVRWEEKLKESIDSQANAIAVDATVWVAQEITVGSIMWLGTLAEWNASEKTNLKQVVGYRSIPNIKGRLFEQTVTVQKYSDSLPSLT